MLGALLDLQGTGAGCGIRYVLNPVERVASARKSPSSGARVALLVRIREFAGPAASDLSYPNLVVLCRLRAARVAS